MTFEQAYDRLQEIYNIINSQEVIDINKLNEMQIESDKLFEFLQSLIKKQEKTDIIL